jgi:hypothetical protein
MVAEDTYKSVGFRRKARQHRNRGSLSTAQEFAGVKRVPTPLSPLQNIALYVVSKSKVLENTMRSSYRK